MSKKKMTGAEIMKEDMKQFDADIKSMMEEDAANKGETPCKQETGETETEKPDSGTEKPETEKRDWVDEAVQCFIKDVKDLDPTDPITAIAGYFAKNATDELKARCKAEGKNATGCWRFIEAVARKALGNRPGHIDPSAIYAIAMHYFEEVPKDWDAAPAKAPARQAKPKAEKKAKPKKPAETPSEIKKEKAKAAKKKVRKVRQGFFFEMLDAPAEGGAE